MLVILGFVIGAGACSFSTGLTIRLLKRIKDTKKREKTKEQNDWRYSRRPDDLRDVPKLYELWDAISVFRELRCNMCGKTRAYKYLIESGHITVKDGGRYEDIYKFDNLKLKTDAYNNRNLAVASMSEPDGKENWVTVTKDKDIQERVEQMLNRLIILLRKTEKDLKNEDDKKFLDQKAVILGNATKKHDTSPMAALKAPSVIKNVLSLTEMDALGIQLRQT
jgi:hypothetical protein